MIGDLQHTSLAVVGYLACVRLLPSPNPAQVADDVLNGYVSKDQAGKVYGSRRYFDPGLLFSKHQRECSPYPGWAIVRSKTRPC